MKEFFLADDLSGALDAAAAFHHAGRRVRIALRSAPGPEVEDAAVVGVTTETRNAAPAEAAARVAAALAAGHARGAGLVYKKIDSTLRGPVAAEVAVVARVLPMARLLFCPANPAVGRTVQDGRLLVHGVPVDATEFARDPVCPVRESDLRRLLGDAGGDRLVIADAETQADLAAAVARMATTGGDWVAIGSGALAGPVARLKGAACPPGSAPVEPPVDSGPILMLGGSAHGSNRDQATRLAQERGVPLIELRPGDPTGAVAAVSARLRSAGSASLLVEATRHDSATVLRALVTVTIEIVSRNRVDRLFITGGETAFAICEALGLSTLAYEGELEPGMSLSRGHNGRGSFRFVVKPGGFGSGQTWIRAWDALV